MRILGIDFGDARIGIAISDPFGWTAQGLDTIAWKNNMDYPIERILKLIKEYNIKKVIVGYPVNMNGTFGPRTIKTDEFIKHLTDKTENVEIKKWDERLSTVAANRILNEVGIKSSRRKKNVDRIAATYILQGYLDSIRNESIKSN